MVIKKDSKKICAIQDSLLIEKMKKVFYKSSFSDILQHRAKNETYVLMCRASTHWHKYHLKA